jgi:hypothetical protein
MDLWQILEMLPTQSEPRLSSPDWWLTTAVYQHLWTGVYARPVDVPIPEWQARRAKRAADALRNGVAAVPSLYLLSGLTIASRQSPRRSTNLKP